MKPSKAVLEGIVSEDHMTPGIIPHNDVRSLTYSGAVYKSKQPRKHRLIAYLRRLFGQD